MEQTQIAAEIDVASLGSTVARLQRENESLLAAKGDRLRDKSQRDREAYELWLEVHGKDGKLKTNAYGPAAQSALTRARRAGLEQDDIEKVIRAHGRFPFLVFGKWAATGSPRDRKDKLSDAFKNEDRWGALLELADAPPTAPPAPRSQHPDFPSYGHDRPLANLLAALEHDNLKPWLSGSGQGSACCPSHDDRQKSFRFRESDSGSVLMYCNVCASRFVTNEAFAEQARIDLELPLTDLYPTRKDG